MGFADTGKLGVAVRPRVYSDRLPKNVAQPGLEGKKLFQIGGVNPTIFNLDAALHAKITQSEYFKCLYVFKTFDKTVDGNFASGGGSSGSMGRQGWEAPLEPTAGDKERHVQVWVWVYM